MKAPVAENRAELTRTMYSVVMSAPYGGNYSANLVARKENFKSDKQL